MGSCVYSVKNVRDLRIAEACACLQGVVFVEEMGFDEDLQGTQRLKELGEENDPHTL
ncbi:hypothetical protein Goklo_027833, partial [Gossypium klotzschianum]|nr:hypothetical protein [Gossypium klotzschianum]